MPPEVAHLVAEILRDPIRIHVSPAAVTVDKVEQRVYHVDSKDKQALLHDLLRDSEMKRAIVFTRTKHGANKVVKRLADAGHAAEAIHGNKSQNARQKALEKFRSGRARLLVATDIAARGLDIDNVTHVVNFELPEVPENMFIASDAPRARKRRHRDFLLRFLGARFPSLDRALGEATADEMDGRGDRQPMPRRRERTGNPRRRSRAPETDPPTQVSTEF